MCSLKSCCACNQLFAEKGECWIGVFCGEIISEDLGLNGVLSLPPVICSPFVLRRLCRKCLHHMEVLVMISPYGKYQLGFFPVKTTLSPPHVS